VHLWDFIVANKEWFLDGLGIFLLSLITSILTFVVSTVIYQNRKEKRQDKVLVFRQLMATRNINDYERIKAINSIDIVFNDCKKVTEACVLYIKSMKDYEADQSDVNKKAVIDKELELLKNISKNLGYKNIDVSAIMDNSFQPNWLNERRNMDYYMLSKLNEFVGTVPKLISTSSKPASPNPPRGRGKGK